MRRSEPMLFFYLGFLILLFEVSLAVPILSADQPVVPPPEALSRIVFVNDLPPGETVTFDFIRGAKVYASSSKDFGAENYESSVHFSIPGIDGIQPKKLTDAASEWDPETGIKWPVFKEKFNRIAVTNENNDKADWKNPGIIYFLLDGNSDENMDKHYSTVYEVTSEQRYIYKKSEHIDSEYITLLNPTGALKIANIRHIEGLTALTVSAGGVEETRSNNYTIHNIGKDDALSKAPLLIVEPVVTVHKQLGIFVSDFEFSARAVDPPNNEVQIPMNWSDWSVGMSRNYMLRNQSESFRYVFNSSEPHSQFDVQMFGEIGKSSQLTISYDGYEGAGSETLMQRHLERVGKNTKGHILTVEYSRGREDTTSGVLVRVHCSQPAALNLLYTVFATVILRHLMV